MNNPVIKNITFVIFAIIASVLVFSFAGNGGSSTTQTEIVRDKESYAVDYAWRANLYARCGATYHTMNHELNIVGLDDLALGAFHTCVMYAGGANEDGADLGDPAEYCKSAFEMSLLEFNDYDHNTLVDTFEKESPICSDSLDVQVEVMKVKNIPVPTSSSEHTEDCPVYGEPGYGKAC